MKRCFVCLFLCLTAIVVARPAQAQTETVLYTFTGGSDGSGPTSCLTADGKGNFYGTTYYGGLGFGTVFELSPNVTGGWNDTILYSFSGGSDGAYPDFSGVVFDKVGNLYGTARGDTYGFGVAFELSPVGENWTETVLYRFVDSIGPVNGLMMDGSGNLYGTAYEGESDGTGVVFELSPHNGSWTERVIYSAAIELPSLSGLTMDTSGNIFGFISSKAFELSPNGNGGWNSTVIYTFNSDSFPRGTPVLDKVGNLYGTTTNGGANDNGTVYMLSPGGQNGKWTRKSLYSFKIGSEDGGQPWAGILFDGAGNIYGTTVTDGTYGDGTVFELVAPVGTGSYKEKILWNFNGTDGSTPYSSLILDSAGNVYGTAFAGGTGNNGVVFKVTPLAVTTATLSSLRNPSTYGEVVTFTAVIAPAPPNAETVSFMKGKTVLGTGTLSGGSASFATSSLPVGTNSITAVYGGDSTFAGGTSKPVKQVVDKATTTSVLSSSPNPSNVGQSVTFVGRVAPEFSGTVTGTVSFYDGTTLLKTVELSKGAAKYTTSTLTSGTYTITATYNGSTDFTGSSDSLTQTVK